MNTIKQVRQKIETLVWDPHLNENYSRYQWDSGAETMVEALIPGDVEGTLCWGDLDYTQSDRSLWETSRHYSRMIVILQSLGRERFFSDLQLQEKMRGALRFWLQHDFRNPNWWYNEIGTPRSIGDLAIMMQPILSSQELQRAAEIVSHGSMAALPDIEARWTGANLIWGTMTTIKHAVILEDEQLLAAAVNRAAKELRYDREGLQKDASFFQHGPRLYSGGYGRSFAFDMAQILYMLQGTPLQIDSEKINLFLIHILDGLRNMTQGSGLDFSTMGREFSRAKATQVGVLRKAVELMTITEGMPRKDELKAYLQEMTWPEGLGVEGGLTYYQKIRYFDQAQLLTVHMKGLYVGAKFHDHRLWDAEICNREGELQYNMSYGTHTCIMRDGKEYLDIDPVMDFSCIPGTTARSENDEQILAHRDWWELPLPNEETFGLEAKGKALISEHAQHDGIDVYVTDFAFEGGFVSLGCGMQDQKGQILHTTIDQCLRRGEVQLTEDGREVVHQSIRYSLLDEHTFVCEQKEAEGAWVRNSMAESSAPIRKDVLLLTIEHDLSEGKTDSYAYLISPAEYSRPEITILSNTPDCQAILLEDGCLMAAFRRDGVFDTPLGPLQGKKGGLIQ